MYSVSLVVVKISEKKWHNKVLVNIMHSLKRRYGFSEARVFGAETIVVNMWPGRHNGDNENSLERDQGEDDLFSLLATVFRNSI